MGMSSRVSSDHEIDTTWSSALNILPDMLVPGPASRPDLMQSLEKQLPSGEGRIS